MMMITASHARASRRFRPWTQSEYNLHCNLLDKINRDLPLLSRWNHFTMPFSRHFAVSMCLKLSSDSRPNREGCDKVSIARTWLWCCISHPCCHPATRHRLVVRKLIGDEQKLSGYKDCTKKLWNFFIVEYCFLMYNIKKYTRWAPPS